MSGMKFSMSFSKKIEKKQLQPSAIRMEGPKVQTKSQPEAISVINEAFLKKSREEKGPELVIPLLPRGPPPLLRPPGEGENTQGKQKENKKEKDENNKEAETRPLTLEEKATLSIIEESRRQVEGGVGEVKGSTMTLTQDPGGLGEEATLEDYEQINVASFGAAALRGMGWSKSKGVGRVGRVVEIIDPSTKTLTLDYKRMKKDDKKQEEEEAEEIPLTRGSYILIHSGRRKGTYGQVEAVEEDHVMVKVAVTKAVVREVEVNLQPVSRRQYDDSARVINKDMYDKFKEDEAKKKAEKKKASSQSIHHDDYERGSSRRGEERSHRGSEGYRHDSREKTLPYSKHSR